MAVRRVDHDHVDPGLDQRRGPLHRLVADADGGPGAQPALIVLGRMGIGFRLLDVLDGHQADQMAVVVGDQKLLDAMPMEKGLRFVAADIVMHRDQVLRRHQVLDRAHWCRWRSGRPDW